MPEHEMDDPKTGQFPPRQAGVPGSPRFPGQLNAHQQNRLRITCQYIDKLLSDAEHILHQATAQSPFPRYVLDVAPAQVRVIEDYIRRVRRQLLRALEWQHMKPGSPDIPATRAVLTNLAFIDIAVEELRPGYMRGSGEVPEDAVGELNGVVHELRSLVEGVERYLRQELTANLETRLQKLENSGYDVALLQAVEEIVTRQGLVEFRPRIGSLAGRMEDNNLEVALFGRVSSGKSSLLNALLGTDVLPVGVNPITAVPTRLRYGSVLRAAVTYGDGRSEILPVDLLGRLVSEKDNPGNLRNVVRAIVEIPSRRLKQGIVLVDTPGLGSLARNGAAETLAYLPVCDLALLLIDAGATLNDEDIGTLRLLYETGIPSLVLLSKSDLLAEEDLHRTITYIEEQLHRELGITVHVHSVSALPRTAALLDCFFEQELLPRFEEAQSLREASVARKIGALRDSVIAALETMADRQDREKPPALPSEVESRLRLITGQIGEMLTSLDRAFLDFGESPDAVLGKAVEPALLWIRSNPGRPVAALQLSDWIHDEVQRFVNQQVQRLRETMEHGIRTLRQAAEDLGSSEAPALDDGENLLRDVPRFALAALPSETNAGRWRWMGDRVIRSAIRNSLRQAFGPAFRNELHVYGNSLRQWSEQAIHKTAALINSYADTYRAQIQRLSGLNEGPQDLAKVKSDLTMLREWNANRDSGLAVKRA
ncbi:MAG TPA: dynamin family protein [Acidobacteriaceae bacterium]|nr:dynamin family protein [Acidobacteriaceae bacterium]